MKAPSPVIRDEWLRAGDAFRVLRATRPDLFSAVPQSHYIYLARRNQNGLAAYNAVRHVTKRWLMVNPWRVLLWRTGEDPNTPEQPLMESPTPSEARRTKPTPKGRSKVGAKIAATARTRSRSRLIAQIEGAL